MLGGVAKISIARTFNELVEIDFVDYGDFATFSHMRDTFPRFPAIIFMGGVEEDGRTNVRNGARKRDFDLVSGVWGARNYRGL